MKNPTNKTQLHLKQINSDRNELDRVNDIKKETFAQELKSSLGIEIKTFLSKKPQKDTFFKKLLRTIGF
jgi:hypothetical protein